ncbi:SWAP/Surp, ENTH/VHS, mRNA splicing factor Cwf21 domain protein [Artemisia annua]|uniref:SWAP/Surp, ENTH/VHS, mRNA splicing factor Cwf21 domain protein n=1 Tax=Artemisia annua TaxID=35608 RepID=A0A2U1MLD2_ARTAN|nr:SWAP/Surp, ENTH/VHS, mRNA splicing factor Cwf21 domain protein [Artemisia annua]
MTSKIDKKNLKILLRPSILVLTLGSLASNFFKLLTPTCDYFEEGSLEASLPRTLSCGGGRSPKDMKQKLRQIEVSLIEYRESLEERGLKKEEIEKKVAAHQKQLQYKYGLTDHNEDSSHKITTGTSSERREKRYDSRESSRKRQRSHHDSESPQRKSSSRDREKGYSWVSCLNPFVSCKQQQQ